MSQSRLSIRASVGEAFAAVRENLGFVVSLAALGTGLVVGLSALNAAVPALGLIGSLASTIVQAVLYAALLGAALYGARGIGGRIVGDGARVWVAMAIIGVLMTLVMFVITIPVIIALVVGPMAPYAADLQAAGSDQTAVMSVMMRFVEENPVALLVTALFYCAVWYLLTSKLYLAAPASVDRSRILTFETWNWTKGALFRIIGARLLLLLPAYVLVFAINYLVGMPLGIDPTDPQTMVALQAQNLPGFLLYVAVGGFVSLLVYTALEAALSTAMYRRLQPAEQPASQA